MKIGDLIWFRGQFAQDFTLRGTIEAMEATGQFGVRLENGNFKWASEAHIKPRVCSGKEAT